MEVIMSISANGDTREVIGEYHEEFANLWNEIWQQWKRNERAKQSAINVYDPKEWKKRFGSSVITRGEGGDWAALKFNNKEEYFLFMMEWS